MESIGTQIFLAWCEYRLFMGKEYNDLTFEEFRVAMLDDLELINVWLRIKP